MKRAVFESLGTWRSAEDTANGRLRKKAMLRWCVEVCCRKEDYVGCGRVISGFRTPRTALITHYSPFPVLPLNSGPGEISRTHVNHRLVAHRCFIRLVFIRHSHFQLGIMSSSLESIELPHLPSLPVHVALYRDVQNAAYLKAQLLAGQADYEYAFVDASMVCFAYLISQHDVRIQKELLLTFFCQ